MEEKFPRNNATYHEEDRRINRGNTDKQAKTERSK